MSDFPRFSIPTTAVVLSLVGCAAVSSSDGSEVSKSNECPGVLCFAPERVDWSGWSPCAVGDPSQGLCGSVQVPLNHLDRSDSRVTSLYVQIIPAADQARRIGPLFANPGGPGVAAASKDFATRIAHASSAPGERFDVVTWNPRGTGDPVANLPALDCIDNKESPWRLLDQSPDNDSERDELDQAAAHFAQRCLANPHYADLLPFMGSDVAAFDMEYLRRAMFPGEAANYIGFSYGTEIGQQYLHFFGQEIRSMILDSVAPVDEDYLEVSRRQTTEQSRVLAEFFSWCARHRPAIGSDPTPGEPTCTFASYAKSPKEIADAFLKLAQRLEQPAANDPIQVMNARTGVTFGNYGLGDLPEASYSGTLFQNAWPTFAAALRAADEGDPQTGERYVYRQAAQLYPRRQKENLGMHYSRVLPLGLSDQAGQYFGDDFDAWHQHVTISDVDPHFGIVCASRRKRTAADLWKLFDSAKGPNGFGSRALQELVYGREPDPFVGDGFPFGEGFTPGDRVASFDFAAVHGAMEYLTCALGDWPASPEPRHHVEYNGNAPVLMINSRMDFATPLVGAQLVHDRLGPKAALVILEAVAHSFTFLGNQCLDEIASTYLADPTTLTKDGVDGTNCPWDKHTHPAIDPYFIPGTSGPPRTQ